jgi:hypothetical protein
VESGSVDFYCPNYLGGYPVWAQGMKISMIGLIGGVVYFSISWRFNRILVDVMSELLRAGR